MFYSIYVGIQFGIGARMSYICRELAIPFKFKMKIWGILITDTLITC